MSLELFDDIKIYLPKYLSAEQQEKLFDELKAFPKNLDSRFYSELLRSESILFQGDGYSEIDYPDYQTKEFKSIKGFLVSNTCDVNEQNDRKFDPYITLAPIFSLSKWEDRLLSEFSEQSVQSHVDSIRNQKVTQFFYLPAQGDRDEQFVRLDCVFSIEITQELLNKLLEYRMFTLSNYGFYMLLLKLGIHLTRVQEKINRDSTSDNS